MEPRAPRGDRGWLHFHLERPELQRKRSLGTLWRKSCTDVAEVLSRRAWGSWKSQSEAQEETGLLCLKEESGIRETQEGLFPKTLKAGSGK